jgi:hypothetical protein
MGTRAIEAPDQDWLTEEEAVAYLRVNSSVFHRLVDAGFVPGVRKLSRELVHYPWRGVVAVALMLELGARPPELAKTGENSPKLGKTGVKSPASLTEENPVE